MSIGITLVGFLSDYINIILSLLLTTDCFTNNGKELGRTVFKSEIAKYIRESCETFVGLSSSDTYIA
jgi:hypothetical protein